MHLCKMHGQHSYGYPSLVDFITGYVKTFLEFTLTPLLWKIKVEDPEHSNIEKFLSRQRKLSMLLSQTLVLILFHQLDLSCTL